MNLNIQKHLNIPDPTNTNEFKPGTMRVIKGDHKPTALSVMAKTIGRPANEVLKRTPPVFDEKLIVFHNPLVKWLHGCYKVMATGKGKSIFG